MEIRRRVTVTNASGLHARPCHALASACQSYASTLQVCCEGRSVNGKSILELMTLGAAQGSVLELVGCGTDAAAMIEDLARLVESGFGERD